MKTKQLTVSILLVLILLSTGLVAGCGSETPPLTPAAENLAETMVPDLPIDIYLYVKQAQPTRFVADTFNLPADMEVVSLALWGLAQEGDFAFGLGLVMATARQAEEVYQGIPSQPENWVKLSGDTIYLVNGSGEAADSLKQAIDAGDFKKYDDADGLAAVSNLPDNGEKVAAVVVIKPSESLIGMLTKDMDEDSRGVVDTVLGLVQLKAMAAEAYTAEQVDAAALMADVNAGAGLDRDLGVLGVIQSGLPGIIVKPGIEKILNEQQFRHSERAGADYYHNSFQAENGTETYVIVRVVGSNVFIAVSGRESYAEKLIQSVE